MKKTSLLLSLLCSAHFVFAQEEQKQADYYELSLEELMNIPINSASKKDETLFDAPLSSYTITKSDIEKSGATSIMEALRMAPGVIVREQTNGVYDIHIRGFDNILQTSQTYTKSNTATLVMIDNRPVFNHNLGGTFWETLPIDLHDVERIEIVRGPSAPLFGPNAVTGVINIITRKIDTDKTYATANVQAGTPATKLANVAVGKTFDKVSVIVSGNYQKRERFDDTYLIPAAGQYYSKDQLVQILGSGINDQYANPALALSRAGANAFIGYAMSDDVSFDVSVGTQQSETQKIFLSNIFVGELPFTTNESNTTYANLSGKIKNFSMRTSYQTGTDNLAVAAAPNQYDYRVFDASAEYTFALGKIGTLVPGMSYQNATYGDEGYKNEGLTFLNGTEQTITTAAAFLRTDLKPIENLRVIAAVRADKFSVPDDVYLAYELATTYKINESNLVRAAVTRSNSGSFFGNSYLNITIPLAPGLDFVRTGSRDLKLFTVNMIEVGFRSQLSKAVQLDVDVFQQTARNFTALTTTQRVQVAPGVFQTTEQRMLNVPTTATQTGVTMSLNIVPNDKFQIKPFVTLQQTNTSDLPSSYASASVDPTLSYSDTEHRNTPSIFGGYYVNIKPVAKLNVNLNGYFFSKHTQYDGMYANGVGAESSITGKLIFNTKISYAISNSVNVFVNGRQVAGAESREFFGGDKTTGVYLGGISLALK